MRLAAHGIALRLPPGWEATIDTDRQDAAAVAAALGRDEHAPAVLPVAHMATVPLPPTRGDFGSNVVDSLGADDIFVALLEYGAEEASSALFAHEGLPRRLDHRAFSSRQLQRTLPNQSGFQLFFHEGARAFCLYVVLGAGHDAPRHVRRVEEILAGVELEASA